ncbi:cytochrome P450, partial [Cadophora sp. DSE1049]
VYNLFLSPLRKFPGPKFAALTKWWEVYHAIKCDRFIVIQKLHEKYGNVIRIGPNEVSIASPRVFHHIFVTKCSSFLKSDFYTTIQPGLGPKYAGLFNETNHAKSQAERRDLQPGMAPARIKVYEKRYDAQLDQLIQVMKKKQEVDLFTLLKFLMLDVIGDLALGQTFKQLETGEEHQYAIDFNNAFMLIGLVYAHAGLSRVFIYAQEKVVVFLSKPMEEKRQSVMSGFLDAKTGAPKPPYTPWYIALAGHGFLVAGSEASSITLSYFIWLLIKHPEVEQRLRHELSTLQPHYTSTDLALRPYLDAVLRETLRVYPPAPAPMPRVVPAEGFSMEGMDYPPK